MMDRRRLLLLGPLGVAAAAGAGFWAVLNRMGEGTFDPHRVDSPLLNRPIPDFQLPGQPPSQGFGAADLRALGKPVLINFFASWCVPCLAEHPDLTSLASEGVPIWAIAYKDTEAATAGFLSQHGNPYARVARDTEGLTAINWGVYGVPETYVVDGGGVIRRKFVGPITPDIADQEIRPLLRQLA
jgi:cytochrome c biogenesis protein CcmG, thiol:disulfide interchange protein DsbE